MEFSCLAHILQKYMGFVLTALKTDYLYGGLEEKMGKPLMLTIPYLYISP